MQSLRNIQAACRACSLLAASMLSACAGVDTVTQHVQLDLRTHLSAAVFLDPPTTGARTVSVAVQDLSGASTLDLRSAFAAALTARGWTVVPSTDNPRETVQISIVQAGRIPKEEAAPLLASGYGQTLASFSPSTASGLSPQAGGLAGAASWAGAAPVLPLAAAAWMMSHAVQDNTFAVAVDVRIAERPPALQATVTRPHVTRAFAVTPLPHVFELRGVACADRVNLSPDEAMPALAARLSDSLAAVFE